MSLTSDTMPPSQLYDAAASIRSLVLKRGRNAELAEKTVLEARSFTDGEALIQSGDVDAVIIATPHFQHTTLGITALNAGVHVMVEKPISAHKADAERLIGDAGTATAIQEPILDCFIASTVRRGRAARYRRRWRVR